MAAEPQVAASRRVAVYDLKGLNCPLPVLRAKKRLSRMRAGSRVWIETTDPLAAIDIPAFCAEAGHRLLATETAPGGHRFLVERGSPRGLVALSMSASSGPSEEQG